MTKPAILTVDDDPQVLGAVARDLRRKYGGDYRILRAESGAAALETVRELKRRDEPVALLLADQRMPRMNGVEFLTDAMTLFPDAKRALLTAYADTDAAIGAINQSRIHYYLLKPWDPPKSGFIRCWTTSWTTGRRATVRPSKEFTSSATAGHRPRTT